MSDSDSVAVTDRTRRLTIIFTCTTVALLLANCALLYYRLVARVRSIRNFLIEDWLLVFGFLVTTSCWATEFASIATFLNPKVTSVPPAYFDWQQPLAFASFNIWSVAFCLIKSSILFTLLRFKDELWWRVLIFGLVGAQVAFTLGDCVYQLANYRILITGSCALDANDPCVPIYENITYAEASFQITTNIVISLLPATFLVQLRRPKWEKILIGILMSMCLAASALSIRKTILNEAYADANEDVADINVAFFNFNCAELLIEIAAACLYGLKSSFLHFLQRVGFNVTARVHRTYGTADDLPDFEGYGEGTTNSRKRPMPLSMV